MLDVQNYQLTRKSPERASVLIEHTVQVINNNKTPSSWTAEEIKNPVIGHRQVQTFITISLTVIKSQESSKMLSGGNFDFRDNIGTGYVLELKYRDNDEAVKELTKWLRELNFSCILGNTSGSCFMADNAAEQSLIEGVLDSICKQMEVRLNEVQFRRHNKDPV